MKGHNNATVRIGTRITSLTATNKKVGVQSPEGWLIVQSEQLQVNVSMNIRSARKASCDAEKHFLCIFCKIDRHESMT